MLLPLKSSRMHFKPSWPFLLMMNHACDGELERGQCNDSRKKNLKRVGMRVGGGHGYNWIHVSLTEMKKIYILGPLGPWGLLLSLGCLPSLRESTIGDSNKSEMKWSEVTEGMNEWFISFHFFSFQTFFVEGIRSITEFDGFICVQGVHTVALETLLARTNFERIPRTPHHI